eukprot:6617812-Prymnesium_polylepis.1
MHRVQPGAQRRMYMRGEEREGEGPTVGHVESRANWRARTFSTFAHGLRTFAEQLQCFSPDAHHVNVCHACEV